MSIGFIRQKAISLISELDLVSPPVDVRSIAESLLLKIVEVHLGDGSDGALIPERREIEVNVDKPHVRQRFTIAHEIGHWVLRHRDRMYEMDEVPTGIYDNRDDSEVDLEEEHRPPTEREANRFAAELLMPAEWMKKSWRELNDPDKLAELYDVSREAMWNRIVDLRLFKA
jgi:Zn-dependent peptidase ImmA (M78 family)